MCPRAAADENRKNIRAPDGGYVDLLAELTQEYATSANLDTAHHRVLDRIRTQMNVAGASFFLLDDENSELVCSACVGQVDITGLRIPAEAGIIGRSVQTGEIQLVSDVSKDPDFYAGTDTESGFATRAILVAPMKIHGKRLGAISVVNSTETSHDFRDLDMELLQSLASAAAMAMHNANIARKLVAQERVRQELSLAANVQNSLLPDCSQLPPNACGLSRSAREMSGDFFDVETLPDGRLYFALADVSGKGLDAALVMVKTTSLFSLLAKSEPEPGRLLAILNRELCNKITAGMFVTMTVGVYDPHSGRICLSNAGHMPTLIRNARGKFRSLSAAMPPLGILCDPQDSKYPEDDLLLCSGELYLYSDGVTEGYIEAGKELGIEGFCDLLDAHAALPMRDRLETIADRLDIEDHGLRDDVTLLGIETPQNRRPALPLEFRVTALPDRLGIIRDLVKHALATAIEAQTDLDAVVLAIDEACQNIIRHAYAGREDGEIQGQLSLDGNRLIVRLMDHAPKVPAQACQPPVEKATSLKPGGLGRHLMHDIMDEVYFDESHTMDESDTGNCLVMVKEL